MSKAFDQVIPDPDFDPGGIVRDVPSRAHRPHGPWFLAGVLGGEVRITNGWISPSAIRLYRFATLAQARAAGDIVMKHTRSFDGGESWHVPSVYAHRPLRDTNTQAALLVAWARELETELRIGLEPLGPGHYSLLHLVPKRARR